MARRNHDLTNQYVDQYYDEYGYDGYGQELDEEELAIIESKKQLKKDKKTAKKQKGVQESDIDEVIAMIQSKDAFTREQIRGTLENFKGDKVLAKEQLLYKLCKFLYIVSFLMYFLQRNQRKKVKQI